MTTITVTKLLTEAKLLISDKVNWTQYVYAKNNDGFTIDPLSKEATCFCSLGALHRAAGLDNIDHAVERDAINILREVIPKNATEWRSIAIFNDDAGRTHEEIMQVFDDAIALSTGKGI